MVEGHFVINVQPLTYLLITHSDSPILPLTLEGSQENQEQFEDRRHL